MFKKIFKKEKTTQIYNNILIAALLIHAARIDENYSEIEKKIIKDSLISLLNINPDEADKLIIEAEKKEEESNQIVEFTKEIKNIRWNLN